ncbi:tRNA methyltransferase [Sulfurisphaera ohwakuensis]|uniref:tRNA (cytidine(56)-2'-O)-methyltransferase n=2 Tax=Sulfurisphaera ohwakuensis TaxID=69656 RepID=A0A650CDX1_SULOH|nr:tRNA methyltransferase [Sulfurisphaera ohwakuensis]
MNLKDIYVLRLHHRLERDKRVTTHVALVARAFGAKGIFIHGEDMNLLKTIEKVKANWGGKYFSIEFVKNPKKVVREWRSSGGIVVHLTMYGIPIDNIIEKIIEKNTKILVIVGSEKVEGWYYYNSDYNIAIGNQPHSEVAALAIFLDRIYKGGELNIQFSDAKLSIIPQERGKKVRKNE